MNVSILYSVLAFVLLIGILVTIHRVGALWGGKTNGDQSPTLFCGFW